MTASPREYQAFLSYRHADNQELGRQWATWLHQRIETYEVPDELVGRTNARGREIPPRIFPVFRDEEELPADADLASPIYRALDASACLIVLCSPRAAASTYVANEIAYFKRIGRAERVLAVLLAGEPNASWDAAKQAAGHDPASECFPTPLRHPVDEEGRLVTEERAEPIAADLRLEDGSEGWTSPEAYRRHLLEEGLGRTEADARVRAYAKRSELAVLKVLAGILGVPLGELTQRDRAHQLERARRRARTFRRVALAMGSLALLALAAGAIAFVQRRAAERARDREATARERAQTSEARTARTLAASDFRRGTAWVRDPRRVDTGLAHLARAARQAAFRPAEIRLWTLLQERAFWVPTAADAAPPVPPAPPPPVPPARPPGPPAGFETVLFGEDAVVPELVVASPDGARVAVAVAGPPGEEDPAFRVFDAERRPLTPWLRPRYEGDFRVWGLRALVFSPEGRHLAVVAKRWREPDTVEVIHVEAAKPVGPPLLAAGEGPSRQFAPFGAVDFVGPATGGLASEGPILVAASSRGDATAHVVVPAWDDLVPLARASHGADVVHAGVDDARAWLMSASSDGEVRVTALEDGAPVGVPFRVEGRVLGLERAGDDALRVRTAEGPPQRYRLLAPLARHVPNVPVPPPTPGSGEPVGGTRPDRFEGPEGLVATVEEGVLRVARGATTLGTRALSPGTRYLGFARAGDAVLATDADFATDLWSPDLGRRLGPRLSEAPLFEVGAVPDRVRAVPADREAGVAVTVSGLWDAPNVMVLWRTVWDLETGEPLSDRVRFVDDGAEADAIDDVRLAEGGGAVLHLGGPPAARRIVWRLELVPPEAARPWLADLAEALGGVTLDDASNPVPLADRAARLESLLSHRTALDRPH